MGNNRIPPYLRSAAARAIQEMPKSLSEMEALERRNADQMMARKYAEAQCPPDIVDFANRHGLENFVQVVWANAFRRGFKAALESEDG